MPYLKPTDKHYLNDGVVYSLPRTAGELNYMITRCLLDYVGKDYDYAKLNEAMGALTCAGQEFYRRVIVPYENKKIEENGDVYE